MAIGVKYIRVLSVAMLAWLGVSARATEPSSDPPPDRVHPWVWLEGEQVCLEPTALADLIQVLERTPAEIVGFAHLEAIVRLRGQAHLLACLREPVSTLHVARLWYLLGMAEIYRHDQEDSLRSGGDAVILEHFRAALALEPQLEWQEEVFGSFGVDLWQRARQLPASEWQEVEVTGAGNARLWVDGKLTSLSGARLLVRAVPHLLQVWQDEAWTARWWIPPLSLAGSLPSGVLPPRTTLEADPTLAASLPPAGASPTVAPGLTEQGGLQAPSRAVLQVRGLVGLLPLRLAGSMLQLTVSPGLPLELSLAVGAARILLEPEAPASYVLIPVVGSVGLRLERRAVALIPSVGYQGFWGGGFGSQQGPGGTGGGATAAHGASGRLELRAHLSGDARRAGARHGSSPDGAGGRPRTTLVLSALGSGGVLFWPGVGSQLQLELGLGLGLGWKSAGGRP